MEETNSTDPNSLLKDQLDNHPYIQEIEIALKGFIFDKTTNKYIRDPKKVALVNDEGVSSIITEIKARVANVNTYSNLDNEIIRIIRMDVFYGLYRDIFINRDKYGLYYLAEANANIHPSLIIEKEVEVEKADGTKIKVIKELHKVYNMHNIERICYIVDDSLHIFLKKTINAGGQKFITQLMGHVKKMINVNTNSDKGETLIK